jgi:hypothetical protein
VSNKYGIVLYSKNNFAITPPENRTIPMPLIKVSLAYTFDNWVLKKNFGGFYCERILSYLIQFLRGKFGL